MFDRLIAFSIRNRTLVVAVAAALAAYGLYAMRELPLDVFPDLNRPTVTIFTEAHGLAPDEVESLVTLPLEAAVNGASHVERVRSSSGTGLSLVYVEFDWQTDIYRARQIVTERIQGVREQLPEDVRPTLGPITSLMGQILVLGLTSDNPDIGPMELRELAEWDLRKRLVSIPGVSQVLIQGGDLKQVQVLVDPFKLFSLGLSLDEVEEALAESNRNTSGGFLVEPYEEKLIRTLARVQSAEELGQTVIRTSPDGSHILLRHIAEIREGGPRLKRGEAGINGKPGVLLTLSKQLNADTLTITRAVEKELGALRASLPDGVELHEEVFRQADFIWRAVHNVQEALRDGSLMVAMVLFLFLLNFRTTAITLTAIPLSILVTLGVFHLWGLTINTMTLGGLAVAIGELVDDAIVDVENVYRRLRENRLAGSPRPVGKVILDACREVRNSIVFATLIVILAFLPLFGLAGMEGRIFAPLAVAYILAIAASLGVAVTLTPALCTFFLPGMKRMEQPGEGLVVRLCKGAVSRALSIGFRAPGAVFALVGLAFAASLWVTPKFGREFLPEFNEGSVTAFVVSAPGTSLEESVRVGQIAEQLIREIPEAQTIGRRTGRAEGDPHVIDVSTSEIEFDLAPSERSKAEIMAHIREQLAQIPGVFTSVGQPISHRIDHILSGVEAQVAIKIFGDDLTRLRAKAEEIRRLLEDIPGCTDVQAERVTLIPQVHIRVDRARASQLGLRPGQVAETAELALRGRVVSRIIKGQRFYDVVLRLPDAVRRDLDAIRAIPVHTIHGEPIPLRMVADVEEAMGPNQISRENGQRRIIVSANVAGRDLVSAVEEARARITEEVDLPLGMAIRYGGQYQSQVEASRRILTLGLLSFLGMFIVLYSHFRSLSLALQVMLNIPLAFIGAVVGVATLSGGTFSIASMVGFIALTGIAARNGILMISHYLHLMRHEGEAFDRAMIVRGTQERIVPVLMTALTAAFALIPLLLGADQPGREILHPVAVVIFCGLFSSTFLDLTVRPLVFYAFSRRTVARLLPEAVGSSSTPPPTSGVAP